MGVGMFAVVAADSASSVIARLATDGIPAWVAGRVSAAVHDLAGFEQGAKGVNGGAVRLVGGYAG
jgi:phosphoribosylformylglycinamidine cyclo-ligase